MKPVYRPIAKKAEKQGDQLFDVLACGHSVPVDESTRANRYRKARACPECTRRVAELAPLYEARTA